MFASFTLRISVDCHACRISIPLNGVINKSLCYHCGEINTFDAGFWAHAIPMACFAEALELPAGSTHESVQLSQGLHVEYGSGVPRCDRCHASEVDLTGIERFAAQGSSTCSACGAEMPVRRADATCQAINIGARFVLNERAPGGAGQSLQARTKPVVFQCMSCGGSLHVDASKRVVTCQYCNNDNYLPDGLWQILNPVPKPQTFFLVCEYESVAERAVRASRTTGDDLSALARDGAPEVRRAVAANPATSPAVLEKLAWDKSREVLEGLAMNPSLPSVVVDEMAHSDDPEFQVLAARHPRLSPGQLPRLARESRHADARYAASARLADLRTRGVHIDEGSAAVPSKGFFARLFGG